MPSKKKKYNARFPAGRIKKIMQTDEDVGKVAQAVPVIISRTLELFVESLLTKSLEVTLKRNAKTLSPSHLKQCILSESRFDFLKDLVKNIPDISQNEEKEAGQTWSTDSSPNANRYNESGSGIQVNPGPSNIARRIKQPSRKDNGQSSDSGSDHEPPNKMMCKTAFGNGRNPQKPSPNFDDELKAFMNRMNQNKKTTTATTPTKTDDFAAPTTSVSTPIVSKENNDNKQRFLNFYAETLPDEDDDKDKNVDKTNHSSVIQPNPEYAAQKSNQGSFGFYKPNNLVSNPAPESGAQVPFAKISIMNPAIDCSAPKLHIDLSKGFAIQSPILPPTDSKSEPFTPSLLLHPQTPALTEEQQRNFKYFTSQKSVGESPSSIIVNNANSTSERRFNFEPSSSKRNCQSEPPMLLPINKHPPYVNKSASVPQRKSSVTELDEDYDT